MFLIFCNKSVFQQLFFLDFFYDKKDGIYNATQINYVMFPNMMPMFSDPFHIKLCERYLCKTRNIYYVNASYVYIYIVICIVICIYIYIYETRNIYYLNDPPQDARLVPVELSSRVAAPNNRTYIYIYIYTSVI